MKNKKTNKWILAIRPKTLPLAVSNTLVGSALAFGNGGFRWSVFILAALTTLLLQIISNLANDYGDFVNGKDNAQRIGPKRMVQAGEIKPQQMLVAIIVVGLITAIIGLSLIVIGTQGIDLYNIILFAFLGLAAIFAAIKYTVGKNPYGYRGLGDIFVFVFFGLVGVCGTYFLHTQRFDFLTLLPAISIGLFSTAVLNMNNMRDYNNDKQLGKRTLVVVMGIEKARYYQLALIAIGMLSTIIYTVFTFQSGWQFLFIISIIPFSSNIKKVFSFEKNEELLPELAKVSMATLLFSLGLGVGIII